MIGKIGINVDNLICRKRSFVGTMATIYSVEESDNSTLRQKNASGSKRRWHKGLQPSYRFVTNGLYVLAMQCMSTLAVVKRETGSWKWSAVQLFYMTGWLTF